VNRILAAAQTAAIDLPPFANSAMDGYALHTRSLVGEPPFGLKCAGESLAGHPFSGLIADNECIRITTGAPVPSWANTVVAQEDCRLEDSLLSINILPANGENVRSAGNDLSRGDTIVQAGKLLNPFDIAWLTACGVTHVSVHEKPRVAVFSTGDELVETGTSLQAGQIYDSNRCVLKELLKRLPVTVTDLGILPDEPIRIREELESARSNHDVLLTTGGVSVGTADYVRDVIAAIGHVDLWRLNLKPGKPLAFGRTGNSLFLGLPGNPVSTIVTFLLIAQPVLLKLAGGDLQTPPAYHATLLEKVTHRPGREEYQRGRLQRSFDQLQVGITGEQSSNRLATFSNADCLVRIPKDSGDMETGEVVEVLPFYGLLG
jgi:molybdopterin molybdotransferase